MDAGNALRTHRLLLRIALAAGNIFAWIFVFEHFYIIDNGNVAVALARVALLYALSQTVTALLTPYTARGLRHGMRREIIYGVLFAAAAFIFLGAIFDGLFGMYYALAMVAFALLLGAYRALYWVPYEVERNEMQARPAGLSREILIALMPAFAGYLLSFDGVHEAWLLFGVGGVMIFSIIPFIRIPDVYEGFIWGYRETFGQLFARAHRRLFWGAVIDGIQGAALLLIWPLVIFLIVGWAYPLFGLLLSFTFLLLIVARDSIQHLLRRMRVFDSLPVRVAIVSSAWIGRILVVNPVSVVVVDAYMHTSDPKISTDNVAFEQVSDGGHFIDHYTALREIGLSIGRIALCFVVAALAGIVPLVFVFGTTFVIAGVCAGLSVLLSSGAKPSI